MDRATGLAIATRSAEAGAGTRAACDEKRGGDEGQMQEAAEAAQG